MWYQKQTPQTLKKGIVFFLPPPFLAIAQGETFQDNTNDLTAPAPIDNYVLLALLLGSYFAYRFFKTQYAINTKK